MGGRRVIRRLQVFMSRSTSGSAVCVRLNRLLDIHGLIFEGWLEVPASAMQSMVASLPQLLDPWPNGFVEAVRFRVHLQLL